MELEGHCIGTQHVTLFSKWEEKKNPTPSPMGLLEPTQALSPNCLFGRKNTADPQQTLKTADMQEIFWDFGRDFFSTLLCNSQKVFNKHDMQQLLRESDLCTEGVPSNTHIGVVPFSLTVNPDILMEAIGLNFIYNQLTAWIAVL